MRSVFLSLSSALLLGGAFVLVGQHHAQARLRAELADLRRQHSALNRLRQENQRLRATEADPEELRRLRDHQANLEALRRQVRDAKLRQEIQAQAWPAGAPPKPLAAGMMPVAGLTAVGQASPQAAARSFFRAVAQIDPDALAAQLEFDDDAKAKADALFNSYDQATRRQIGSSERMMAIFFAEYYSRVSGIQAPEFFQSSAPDSGHWRVKLQTASGWLTEADFPVHRSPDGWHEVIRGYWIDHWSNYLK